MAGQVLEKDESVLYNDTEFVGRPPLLVLIHRVVLGELPRLLWAAAVLFVPLYLVGTVVGAITSGREAAIVNGEFEILQEFGMTELAIGGGLLVVSALASGVFVITGIVMAAGSILRVPVSPSRALRTALRRIPTLLAMVFPLVAGIVLVAALIYLISLEVDDSSATILAAVLIGVPYLIVTLPWSLTLPTAVLERRGIFRASKRWFGVVKYRRASVVTLIVIGVLVEPPLLVGVLRYGSDLIPAPFGAITEQLPALLVSAIGLAMVAATMTVVFLAPRDDLYGRHAIADLTRIRETLETLRPGHPERRGLIRPVLPLLALIAPGLLLIGYLWSNPVGLAISYEQVLEENPPSGPVRLQVSAAGQPSVATQGGFLSSLRFCRDEACSSDVQVETIFEDEDDIGSRTYGAVAIDREKLAVAAWQFDPKRTKETEDGRRINAYKLRLLRCVPSGCEDSARTPVLARLKGEYVHDTTSTTMARRGHGVVIAYTTRSAPPGSDVDLRLLFCADLECEDPQHVRIPTLFDARIDPVLLDEEAVLDLAVTNDGRPVVAYEHAETGAIAVVTCDTPRCRKPAVRHPVPPLIPQQSTSRVQGLDVDVRPDGRPVVVQRDPRDGSARMLLCQTTDCARVSVRELAGPGWFRPPPALAVDGHGRLLVATYDMTRKNLVLISCADRECRNRTTTPLTSFDFGPGNLDLAVGTDNRPIVLWTDRNPDPDLDEESDTRRLLTCREPLCGATP